jgi:hypothetical protein
MYTPNSPKEDENNALPEWHDPFREPQTLPSGWDLSEMLLAPSPDGVNPSDSAIED